MNVREVNFEDLKERYYYGTNAYKITEANLNIRHDIFAFEDDILGGGTRKNVSFSEDGILEDFIRFCKILEIAAAINYIYIDNKQDFIIDIKNAIECHLNKMTYDSKLIRLLENRLTAEVSEGEKNDYDLRHQHFMEFIALEDGYYSIIKKNIYQSNIYNQGSARCYKSPWMDLMLTIISNEEIFVDFIRNYDGDGQAYQDLEGFMSLCEFYCEYYHFMNKVEEDYFMYNDDKEYKDKYSVDYIKYYFYYYEAIFDNEFYAETIEYALSKMFDWRNDNYLEFVYSAKNIAQKTLIAIRGVNDIYEKYMGRSSEPEKYDFKSFIRPEKDIIEKLFELPKSLINELRIPKRVYDDIHDLWSRKLYYKYSKETKQAEKKLGDIIKKMKRSGDI